MLNSEYQRGLEAAAKLTCPMCRGDDNYYEAEQEVVWADVTYVSNYGEIKPCWAHIGGSVEFVPCEAGAIQAAIRELSPQPPIVEGDGDGGLCGEFIGQYPIGSLGRQYQFLCSFKAGHAGLHQVLFTRKLAEDSVEGPQPRWSEFWERFHGLWGMWHDGIAYEQSIKDQWGRLLNMAQRLESEPATPPTPIRGACPLCGSKQPDVYLGKCSDYQLRNKPGHLFHWDSTSDAMRAKMVGTPPTPQPTILMCSCGSEFKPQCPDCKKLHDGRAGVPVEPQQLIRKKCPKCDELLDGNGMIYWCESGHIFDAPEFQKGSHAEQSARRDNAADSGRSFDPVAEAGVEPTPKEAK